MTRTFLLLVWLTFFVLESKSQSYYFRKYEVENGLCNNSVFAITQDNKGFMWFGTKDGLARFDGYSFKVFKKDSNNPQSIGNNFIHSLKEDDHGILWIGTEGGLYRYFPQNEAFELISQTNGIHIFEIDCDKIGNIWLNTSAGPCKFSVKNNSVLFFNQTKESFPSTGFCISPKGVVWASIGDGTLRRYNPSDNSFESFNLFPASYKGDRAIGALACFDENQVFISGRPNAEFKIFDVKSSSTKTVALSPDNTPNVFTRNILQVSKQEYWITSESGIFVYNTAKNSAYHLKKQVNNPFSLNDNSVYPIYKDKEGGIWLGTYFGGINYCPKREIEFQAYIPSASKNSLSGNVAREIKEDAYGKLWIGTEDGGVNRFDPSTGKFESFLPANDNNTISSQNIHGLVVSNNELWIGTFYGGLDVMDVRSGKVIRKYKANQQTGLTSNFIYCLYKTRAGEILVGGPSGLLRYEQKKDRFTPFSPFPMQFWYSYITEDTRGNIYGCTFGGGVFCYSTKTKTVVNIKDVSAGDNKLVIDRVNSCFEDSKKNMWFATENGLFKWNPLKNNWKQYTTKNGFPANYILSIIEDKQQQLWISTTMGLVRFNPVNLGIKVFTKADGLPGNQLNYNSVLKSSTGEIYFGCFKGLIRFNPLSFDKEKYIPPVYLTSLLINNKEVGVKETGGVLNKSIILTRSIKLTHEESSFSLEFSSLNFSNTESQRYAFKLEGMSKNWTYLGFNRKVYFTSLPEGNYLFKVKAFNSEGNWAGSTATVAIHVLPPWWKSTWAYIAYITCLCLILFTIIRIYHIQMKLKNQKRIALLELAKEKEIIEAKIDFFTNVAHEIRTPLTLIKVPLRTINRMASSVPEIFKSLKIINYNTDRLIELSNQLLDFREAEISDFKRDLKLCNISELLQSTYESFRPLAEQKGIEFSLNEQVDPVFATTDVDSLNKILFNLISNSIKYAASKSAVNLTSTSAIILIEVVNDGDIIDEEYREKIFEPFFRIKKHGHIEGTGIGLPLARSLTVLIGGQLKYSCNSESQNVFSLILPITTVNL